MNKNNSIFSSVACRKIDFCFNQNPPPSELLNELLNDDFDQIPCDRKGLRTNRPVAHFHQHMRYPPSALDTLDHEK